MRLFKARFILPRVLALVLIGAVGAAIFVSFSASAKGKRVAKSGHAKAGSSTLSRDLVFDGSTVGGRYHSAGEAMSIVETEKDLINLIGMRRNFKDRLNAERVRLNNQVARK